MKPFLVTAILFVCLSSGVLAQDNASLMPGRDAETYQQQSGGVACRVYPKYVVKTENSSNGSERVSVFRNATTGIAACSAAKEPIITLSGTYSGKNPNIGEDIMSNFAGLSGKYLFIEKIEEPFIGGIEIFDLNTSKSVFKDEMYANTKLVRKRFLSYDKWSKKDGSIKNCRQAAKWKKSGLGVGWVRRYTLDINTLKLATGALRCEATQ